MEKADDDQDSDREEYVHEIVLISRPQRDCQVFCVSFKKKF